MAALFWSSCEMQVVPKEIRSQAQTAAAANAPVDLCLFSDFHVESWADKYGNHATFAAAAVAAAG
eukprot:CAMPEP_0172709902 /NCGR_PEP_ID=MMETSP1074-20121228/55340_1 /TAXON_ID=2916 /ORGANISM="Ceratium fusus, Strain PA161109" /LENGTH=64 /DNA_ID=CAMNT_0013533223 /DNA_START=551 /DNA_END=743 /DNA_ORIENTATION=-